MSKKSLIEREKKRRFLVEKFSLLRKSLKNDLVHSKDFDEKLSFSFKLQKLPRNSSPTRLHNRCMITGRPRGFYRFFRLSRHVLREMAHSADLPGVTKSSW
uniref:Small ribosomal subunit protein uS14c n=1 Tax=Lepocinclis playfairiana TaxID=1403386 RepID=A0A3G3LLI5_9EUGL|nr:ribosomal protein S14 [Lepocinclis playfairiana]AYQ93569.1 ribosomal protein S14 [Lepocinclis playfairiana]